MSRPLSFLEKSPEAVLRDIIGFWQGSTGRVLYPSQIENLEMHALAYRESLLRGDIQWCAEQNLVEYAIGPHMDALGAMLGCARLRPAKAEAKARFCLDAPSAGGRSFAAGTVIATEDGKVSFETLAPAYVLSGQAESSIVWARCTVAGVGGNGLEAGTVCSLDPKIDGVSAANVTATEGGADMEPDAAYRARLLLAPARMGCGGSRNAYRAWAMEASALVADAWAERGAERGDINIYILSVDGEPSQELIGKVQGTVDRPDVRLINDDVFVLPAIRREYAIKALVTVYDNYDPQMALDRATAMAHEYARRQRLTLGRDITPTQLLMAMSPIGETLYHVDLLEPSGILEINEKEWPCATEIEITLAGVSNG